MGRGDKKTRKGKIFAGSFGKARPHKITAAVTPKKVKVTAETEAKPKKAKAAPKAKVKPEEETAAAAE